MDTYREATVIETIYINVTKKDNLLIKAYKDDKILVVKDEEPLLRGKFKGVDILIPANSVEIKPLFEN